MKVELNEQLINEILNWFENANEYEETCYMQANDLLVKVAIEINNQKIKEEKEFEDHIDDMLNSVSC